MKRSHILSSVVAVASTLSLTIASQASAAVPVAVTTALSDMQADVVTVATALVVAAGAVIGLKWMKGAIFG